MDNICSVTGIRVVQYLCKVIFLLWFLGVFPPQIVRLASSQGDYTFSDYWLLFTSLPGIERS